MYDRKSELEMMLKEANEVPSEMNITNIKKTVRKKVFRHKILCVSRNIAATFVVVIMIFALGVNLSPTFAKAMSEIPLLNRLAKSVDFNEGYKDAVENNYMVKVGQVKETKFGKIKLSYYIADKKGAIFFFQAEDMKKGIDKKELCVAVDSIKNTDTGQEGKNVGALIPSFEKEYAAATLQTWPEGFAYPKNLELTVEINLGDEKEFITYHLTMAKPLEERVYKVKKEIEVKKQKITIDKVTVYPTCTYIEYSEEKNNTMDLLNIDFYLVDKKGTKRGSKRTVTYGDDNGIMIASGYFALGDDINLVVDKVNLLPKDKRRVRYNTKTKEFMDSDGIMDNVQVVEDKKILKKYGYAKEQNEIWFVIDMPEMKTVGNSFLQMDEETGEVLDTWFGVKWFEDQTIYTMPKAMERNSDGVVILEREFAEYFEEPDIRIPLK